MFRKEKLKRLWPLGAFFLVYTLAFLLWVKTFLYTLPFLLGLLIALVLQPAVGFVQKKFGWSRGIVSGVAVVLSVALLIFALCLLLVIAVKEITSLVIQAAEGGFPEFSPQVRSVFQQLGRFINSLDFFDMQKILDFLQNSLGTAIALLDGVLKAAGSLPIMVTMILVTAFSAFLFTRDLPKLKRWARGNISEKALSHLKSAVENNSGTGKKYFASYIFLYFLSFCEAYIVLTVVGIPYPLLTAMAVCIADLLPVLGPGFVFLPVAVYQLLTGAYARAGGVLVGWLVMSLVRQIVEPRLVASTAKVPPLAMLAGLYFSLVSGCIWVLLYTLGLCMLYATFRSTGALPPVICLEEDESE